MNLKVRIVSFLADDLARKTLLTILLRGLAALATIIAFMLLARMLMPEDMGAFVFGYSMAQLATGFLLLGSDGLLPQAVGRFQGKDKRQYALAIRNWFTLRALPLALLVLVIVAAIDYIKDGFFSLSLFVFLFLIPFLLLRLHQQMLIACKQAVKASGLQFSYQFLWLLILVIFFFIKWDNRYLLVVTVIIAGVIFLPFLYQAPQLLLSNAKKPAGSIITFLLLSSVGLINARVDIMILKLFSNNIQIAVYGIAVQWSVAISFILSAINANIMAHIASIYTKHDRILLQAELKRCVKIIVCLTLPLLLLLIIAGQWLFRLYGSEYQHSYTIFLILIVGQVVNVMAGSVGLVLAMTRNEKIVFRTTILTLLINLGLSVLLAPIYGADGVAIAVVVSIITWNILLYFFVKQKLKVDTSIVSLFLK